MADLKTVLKTIRELKLDEKFDAFISPITSELESITTSFTSVTTRTLNLYENYLDLSKYTRDILATLPPEVLSYLTLQVISPAPEVSISPEPAPTTLPTPGSR